MYSIQVYYPGGTGPQATFSTTSATEVLTLVQQALEEHKGCERVVVSLAGTRLFAVDCAGNRLP